MDIKLSKRMQAVADMVMEKKVVDIGCDHAFVSIYLAQKPGVEAVIAMDVKKGPVDIARANVASHNLTHKIDVRMSNGFDALKEGEAQTAVIAGMGGYLMIDILKAGYKHLDDGIKLVLQPQSDIDVVRKYLTMVGYDIIQEEMLIDDGKYYAIIRAEKLEGGQINYSEDQYCYGPVLLNGKHPVLKEYLELSRAKNNELIEKLSVMGTEKAQDRITQLKSAIEDIDRVLQEFY